MELELSMKILMKFMDMKILIASIIAVSLIVGLSLTSVVGYQSVESNLKSSPLFNVRSRRAIEEETKDLICNYIGKGEVSIIPLSIQDNKLTIIQKAIYKIGNMDDKVFNRFIDFLINHKGRRIKAENIPKMLNGLHQLKINPDELKENIAEEKENIFYTEEYCETVGFIWVPGCFIALIMTYIIWLVLSFVTLIGDCL
jgi:hypothetical protein